ncbi:hypothetical protein B0T18DRAFT_159072 [Schizothecium vesticola]|uniref:Uncharacterized protein n=1 Tax=Schizothecium vesticola TaxID=314040 RepID=A0AA40K5J8_9PEZI|nr:hypothetical protein B0T18DRAFT_159072 [Schizothecium vesticola]
MREGAGGRIGDPAVDAREAPVLAVAAAVEIPGLVLSGSVLPEADGHAIGRRMVKTLVPDDPGALADPAADDLHVARVPVPGAREDTAAPAGPRPARRVRAADERRPVLGVHQRLPEQEPVEESRRQTVAHVALQLPPHLAADARKGPEDVRLDGELPVRVVLDQALYLPQVVVRAGKGRLGHLRDDGRILELALCEGEFTAAVKTGGAVRKHEVATGKVLLLVSPRVS